MEFWVLIQLLFYTAILLNDFGIGKSRSLNLISDCSIHTKLHLTH